MKDGKRSKDSGDVEKVGNDDAGGLTGEDPIIDCDVRSGFSIVSPFSGNVPGDRLVSSIICSRLNRFSPFFLLLVLWVSPLMSGLSVLSSLTGLQVGVARTVGAHTCLCLPEAVHFGELTGTWVARLTQPFWTSHMTVLDVAYVSRESGHCKSHSRF